MSSFGKCIVRTASLAAVAALAGCAGGFGSGPAGDMRTTGMNGPRYGFDWPDAAAAPAPEPAAPAATPAPAAPAATP